MYTKRFAIFAILVGAVGLVIILSPLWTYDKHISSEWSYPENKWNTLLFFTTISNILVDTWFLITGIAIVFGGRRLFNFLIKPELMGALVVYIATVCIIYCTMIFWYVGPFSWELWWANVFDLWNHVLLPAFMVGTWLLMKKHALVHPQIIYAWLIFPTVYFIASVIRGLIDGWYPYTFFEPSWVLFPLGVSVTALCLALLAWLVIKVNNRYSR